MKTVVFDGATDTQVRWGGNSDPRGVLKVGDEYEVEATEVHSWHTKIKLKGFDGWYNDSSFTYTSHGDK